MADSVSVASVLGKLGKAYKDAIQDVKRVGTIKRVFLESPQLNFIFGGGFGMGRIYEFSGPESGGKSTLATYIGGEIQKKYEKPIVVYVDFEYSFDEKFANKLGLSTDKENFILLRPLTGEQGFTLLKELITQLPIGLVIWDSLASTPSHSQVEEHDKANFGATAKVFANGLKFINPILARHDCSMVVINQERDSMSLFGADFTTTGGRAIKYYASWRGRVTRIDDILDKGSLVGIVSKVRATKNKIGINKREAELKLKFASGFDSEEEYIKFVIDLGIVTQKGAWFYQEDWEYKGSGRSSLVEFLRSKPELFESVKNTVNAQLCGETTIDRENALKATDEDYDPEEETPPED